MGICLENIQRVHFMADLSSQTCHLIIEKYKRNGILIQFPVYSTASGIIMKTYLQIQLQREKLKREKSMLVQVIVYNTPENIHAFFSMLSFIMCTWKWKTQESEMEVWTSINTSANFQKMSSHCGATFRTVQISAAKTHKHTIPAVLGQRKIGI